MNDERASVRSGPPERSRGILRHPPFAYFWSATTIRAFGGAIAGVAFQVLIVTVVNATPLQISVLNALGVVPYLFLGLIVGALMDRWSRCTCGSSATASS
ncbi:MFS transporter [Microbacterium lacticum]|uniref:MFS transporter n=1 Tax=Microbacterium lacticum TaxID=33885 RepID=UPI001E3402F2|nr:MFS transporter [Microbacterium lacticum]